MREVRVDSLTPTRIVELAQAGRIRIPEFQRGYRWRVGEVVDLFDSVVKRYPIGNLLFWELSQIPRIMRTGFVFVLAADRTLQGIVTTADLSQQFADLAGPFFVVAEIERRLRRIINRIFDADEIRAAANPADPSRQPESADHLTLGECNRLLQQPRNWARLNWQVERDVFIEALEGVGRTRNEIMHFSPDPLEPVQIVDLESFAKWLRSLDPDS